MPTRFSVMVASRILQARLDKGWSQGDLARETGIPQGTISRYEGGERRGIHPGNLLKIAECTGVSVDFLLGRDAHTDIGPRIKKARGLKRMTQQQLSDAAGIPLSLLRQFESSPGRRIDPELVERIAKATGVMVDFLMGDQAERCH